MSKKIDIDHVLVKIPSKIIIDGKDYPIHQHNIDVVRDYWETKDESVLDRLKSFSFVI